MDKNIESMIGDLKRHLEITRFPGNDIERYISDFKKDIRYLRNHFTHGQKLKKRTLNYLSNKIKTMYSLDLDSQRISLHDDILDVYLLSMTKTLLIEFERLLSENIKKDV